MVGQRGNFFVSPKGGKDFPMMVPKNPKSTSSYYVAKVGSDSQKGPVKFSTIVRPNFLQSLVLSVDAVFGTSMPAASFSWAGLAVQEPNWTGSGVAFYGVSNSELLKLTFYQSALGLDQDLGEISVEISDVRKAVYRDQKGCMRREFDLQDADCGSIEIELLFVPEFWCSFDGANKRYVMQWYLHKVTTCSFGFQTLVAEKFR
jgi:hypothetical protein